MQKLAQFLLGIRDSLSLTWISKILFYTHPQTGTRHPDAKKLLLVIYRTLVQVLVVYILLPMLLRTLSEYFWIFTIVYYYGLSLTTILTYGYTFIYFGDVYEYSNNIIKWNKKVCNELKRQFAYSDLDDKFTTETLSAFSNKLQSFIFLACYGIFYLVLSKLIIHIPYFGILILIISQALFNGIFYFLRKWPYDEFNVGFIEKKITYMIGYGLFVSFVCNYLFKDNTLLSNGAYFLISVWMIINSIVSNPPDLETKSFAEAINITSVKRNNYTNSYNAHRRKLYQEEYRKQIKDIVILRPILMLTDYLKKLTK